MLILLTPTDNIFKFKVYEVVDGIPSALNLDINSTYSLVFYDKVGNEYTYEQSDNSSFTKLSIGEIGFKVPKEDAKNILNGNNRKVLILATGEDDTSSVIYNFNWKNQDEMQDIIDNQNTVKAEAEQITDAELTAIQEAANQSDNPVEGVDIPGAVSDKRTSKNETSSVNRIKPPFDSEQ
jgi:hypothetical protein